MGSEQSAQPLRRSDEVPYWVGMLLGLCIALGIAQSLATALWPANHGIVTALVAALSIAGLTVLIIRRPVRNGEPSPTLAVRFMLGLWPSVARFWLSTTAQPLTGLCLIPTRASARICRSGRNDAGARTVPLVRP